ncbi:hypothetical protein DPMN_120742 [Dreissena polymorpha]|uniref:Uncharacterized protein n=1 Tax=Dreissena polymorpha TaxID=45954 RepID=A0A9D4GLC5_DREPO|nr:hypothetical protein DPMN_120742 [Dreissena polymorpha]
MEVKNKSSTSKTSTNPIHKHGTSSMNGSNVLDEIHHKADTSEDDVDDSEKCCVCKLFTPAELKYCISLTLVKWPQCDICDSWVHLKFCTPVQVLRRGDQFLCPKCASKEE